MLSALRRRLADRPDTEHEQAFVRLALVCLVIAYLSPHAPADGPAGAAGPALGWSLAALLINALGICAHIISHPAACVTRRVYAIASDVTAVSCFLWLAGFNGQMLTLLYVWITIANGFRYGPRYLLIAATLSFLGFGIVIALVPWWQSHLQIGFAVALAGAALCWDVLSLVRKNFEAIARAEAANAAKRRFVSNVSHEMRTPLNAVVNMSQLLAQTELKRDQRDLLDTVSSASQVLLQLINDVLDFSKIEAGKLQIERIRFDLHAFVNTTVRIFRPEAELKGLQMHVAVMPQVPHDLLGDPHHLRQVLMNLLSNALKFTERGAVTVEIAVLRNGSQDVMLRFAVRDTGIGMSRQALAHVFESFSQAEAGISRRFGGTGLGTTIARQLVELMGGTMGVESTEGQGTTFWFELPFAKAQDSVRDDAASELVGTYVLAGLPESIATRLASVLARGGCTVERVADVDDAAAQTDRAGSAIRGVVVWVEDPSAAQSVAARFHARTRRDRPPLVLCVDHASPSERSVYLAVGYASVIESSWSDELVFNAMRAVVVTEAAPKSGAEQLSERSPQVALKILVVDDTAMNLVVARKVLMLASHSTVCVGSGEEALQALQREPGGFDMVITDLHMPGMDGLMLTRAIRALTRDSDRHMPVIVLTADVTPEARGDVLAAGADMMMSKPINAKELLRTIAELHTVAPRAATAAAQGTPANPADAGKPLVDAALIDPEVLAVIASLDERGGLIGRLIERYVRETQRAVEACRSAASRNDLRGLRLAAEDIVGLAASVGARGMINACSLTALPHDASHPRELVSFADGLQRRFARTLEALDAYLASRTPTAP